MSDVNVKVGLTNAEFKTGLEKLKGDLKGWKREQESAFSGLGGKLSGALAGAFSIGAVVSFAKSMIDLGSDINDTADEVQLSTDAFQELTYAFSQNGASAEQTAKGLKKLSENIVEARNGNEKMIASFARAGVTWADLNRLSPEQILNKIADGLQKISDPAESVAIAIDLMGRSGARMAVTLRQGNSELESLRGQASKLSAEEVAALDNAGDALDRLWNKVKVFGAKGVLAVLGPAPAQPYEKPCARKPDSPEKKKLRDLGILPHRSTPAAELPDLLIPDPRNEPTLEPAEKARLLKDDAETKAQQQRDAILNGGPKSIPADPATRAALEEAAKLAADQDRQARQAAEKLGDLQAENDQREKDQAETIAKTKRATGYESEKSAIRLLELTDREAAHKASLALLEHQIADNVIEAKDAEEVRRAEIEKQNTALREQLAEMKRIKGIADILKTPQQKREERAEARRARRAGRVFDSRQRDDADQQARGAYDTAADPRTAEQRNAPSDFSKLFPKARLPAPEAANPSPAGKSDGGTNDMATSLKNIEAAITTLTNKVNTA